MPTKISALPSVASTGPTDTIPIVQGGVTKKMTMGQGTATNDSAAAGQEGELLTTTVATGSAVGLTTATPANMCSVSLTAGDWDVSVVMNFNVTGATGTQFQSGASLTTATLPTQAGGAGLGTDALGSFPIPITGLTGDLILNTGPTRVSLASTTTVFAVASATFSVGSVSVFGTIRARRMR